VITGEINVHILEKIFYLLFRSLISGEFIPYICLKKLISLQLIGLTKEFALNGISMALQLARFTVIYVGFLGREFFASASKQSNSIRSRLRNVNETCSVFMCYSLVAI